MLTCLANLIVHWWNFFLHSVHKLQHTTDPSFFVVFEHFQWVSRLYLFLGHLHSCPLKLALQTRCYVTVFFRTQVQIQASALRVSKTLYLVWMKGINTQNHSSWRQKHCREAKARTQTSSKGMWQSWNQGQKNSCELESRKYSQTLVWELGTTLQMTQHPIMVLGHSCLLFVAGAARQPEEN